MRVCPICEHRKVRNHYYFCDGCYRLFYNDIKAHAPWVKELLRLFRKTQYKERKIYQHEILIDDYFLVIGDDSNIYYNYEHD